MNLERDEELENETNGSTERQIALALLTRLTNAGSRDVYRRDLNYFMNWWHDDFLPTRDVELEARGPLMSKKADLDAYVRFLTDADDPELSPATINRRIAVVSSFYEEACDLEHRDTNPAKRVKRPKIDNEDVRTGLSAVDAGLLIAAADDWTDQREGTLVILMLTHGLRVSEAVNLRSKDVSTDGGHLKLAIKRKGRDGKSTIVIDDRSLAQRLESLAGSPNDRLFGTMSRFGAVRSVARIGRAAELDPVPHPHILRHTFVAQALRVGYSIEEVRSMAGHSSIRTTQRYAKAIESETMSIGLDLRRHFESARRSGEI